jgi:CubicO group peptidase (beta-lactamase class C family)
VSAGRDDKAGGAAAICALLQEGAQVGVFPSASACAIHEGKTLFSASAGEGATESTLYDLASLTKVICTTPVFVALWAEGKVGPQTLVGRFFPKSPLAQQGVTLADLLFHRSGLPAFVPYFSRVMPAVPELFSADCPPQTRRDVREGVVEAAGRSPPQAAPQAQVVYSDVGFILLAECLAQAAEMPLDALYEAKVAGPLSLDIHFHRLSEPLPERPVAPTGKTRPREPAPGQEGMWPPLETHPTKPGEVDDDNAWVMDGVAGHAGLFGTAAQVARFGHCILEELGGAAKLAPAPLWHMAVQRDTATPNSSRVLGFDTPSGEMPSAGKYLGRAADKGTAVTALGHLGFTGTSLWLDISRALSVALCTNRSYLGRAEMRIKQFRPRFHDAVMEAFGLTSHD